MQTTTSLSSINEQVIIRSYLTAAAYFSDYFKYRKQQDETFSYQLWAEELGFKSRSYLRMICLGERNITPAFLEAFSKRMNLSDADREHISLLALHQKAKSKAQKKIYLDMILENMSAFQDVAKIKDYTLFLSSPYIPLIQLLLTFRDFKGTQTQLCNVLKISPKALQKELAILKKLDLIYAVETETESEKIWKSRASSFSIPDQYQDSALCIYHRQSIRESLERVDLHIPEQRFRSIYVPVQLEKFNEFKEDIEVFLKKMKFKYGSEILEDRKVFKINLQTFALTEIAKK